MEELLKAYYACLELAKENAFKCVIWVDTNRFGDTNFFEVMVKPFDEKVCFENMVFFREVQPDELQSNVEKVKQLIQEASC